MQLLCRLPGGQYLRRGRRATPRPVAEDLERALPELVTAKMTKSLRPGKVFFDWSQNAAAKTTVSAYSLRAHRHRRPSPPRSPGPRSRPAQVAPLGPDEVLARVETHGDLLAALLPS